MTDFTSISSVMTSTMAKTTQATNKTEMDKDTFLKLLVAQLKYQDPTKPADATQFLAQSAQFAMVEKLTDVAKYSEELVMGQTLSSASSLIGKSVSYLDADKNTIKGTVSAAHISNNQVTLRIGDKDVLLSAITDITK